MRDESSPSVQAALRRGPFVGRLLELAALRAALGKAVDGTDQLVMLAGDAGLGKTRIAQELADEAARRGMLVLWGRCLEGPGARRTGHGYRPYGIQSYQAVAAVQQRHPDVTLVSMGDRAADIYEPFAEAARELARPKLLIRAKHDREVQDEQARLFEKIHAQPIG